MRSTLRFQMTKIINFIKREPVAVAFAVNAVFGAASQFGLSLGPGRVIALNVLVAALLTVICRRNVTPVQATAFAAVNFQPVKAE